MATKKIPPISSDKATPTSEKVKRLRKEAAKKKKKS